MSRDSSCTARNISYVFRVVLGWALHPSSTSLLLGPLPPPSSPLLPADVWCHCLPSWRGSCIRTQSSSHSYTIPPPVHPHSLPEKCWVTDENLANLPLVLILSFFLLFHIKLPSLDEWQNFPPLPILMHFLPHMAPGHCHCAAGSSKQGGEVLGSQVKYGYICSDGK